MKLKVTFTRHISNSHFNRLKCNVRQSHMVMPSELQPGYSNGQFTALSSTFFGKAWAVTGRYELEKMLKLSQMEGSAVVPSHRVSRHPMAGSHGNNFC